MVRAFFACPRSSDVGRCATPWGPFAVLFATLGLLVALGWPRPAHAEPEPEPALAWGLLEADVPASACAAQRLTLRVRIENRGGETWSSTTRDHLAYHWADATGTILVRDGLRTELPDDLGPGQAVTLAAQVETPPEPGRYLLIWEMVRERVRWYGAPSEGSDRTAVDVGPPAFAWAVEPVGFPDELRAGRESTIDVALENRGCATWSPATLDRLSYRLERADAAEGAAVQAEEGARTELPGPVAPGERVTVPMKVVAPAGMGRYQLRVEMVREHVTWFGPPVAGIADAVIRVLPTERFAWELVEADFPAWVWVNHPFEVEVEVRNLGHEAWDPDLRDHLSYHWRAADGTMLIRDGRRTDLPHAVEPGQTAVVYVRAFGPPAPGEYVLELDVVREHVAWLGPPRGEVSATAPLVANWRFVFEGGTFALVVVLSALLLRFGHRFELDGLASPLVLCATIAAIVLVQLGFAELGARELWDGTLGTVISGSILVAAPLAALRPRTGAWVGTVLVSFATLVVLADLGYLHFFGTIVPPSALAAVHQLGDAGDGILATLEPAHVWLLLVPAAMAAMALVLPRSRSGRTPERGRWIVVAVAVGLGLPAALRIGSAVVGELGRRVFSNERNVQRFGVLNAHLFDAARTVADLASRGPLTATERDEVVSYFHERAAARPPPGEGWARAFGHNLVLIQVEALQGFAVDAEVEGQEVMPFLRRLRDRALYFPWIFDQTHHGRTSDAEYLVLQSQHPMEDGALAFLRDDDQFHTLAHELRDRGYATLSAHPYKRGFWNRAVLHPRYGFERSLFDRELGDGTVVGWGLSDAQFLSRMIPVLSELEQPFFAFLITLSLHYPYGSFPAHLRRLGLGELEGSTLGNYLHAMHHFDGALEHFVQALDDEGLLDHTLVAVYGDHDTRLPLSPDLAALAGIDPWDPAADLLFDRIPLFVLADGAGVRGPRTAVGGHVDLAPTLLHLLGVAPPPVFVGHSLLGDARPVVLPDGSSADASRLWLAGRGAGRRGGCLERHARVALGREACDALAEAAVRELRYSRQVLDHDLFQLLLPR